MVFEDKIVDIVLKSKCVSGIWANDIARQMSDGASPNCLMRKLLLLNEWIKIMQCYYDEHYSDAAGSITPAYECLTFAQAQSIIAKMEKLACTKN